MSQNYVKSGYILTVVAPAGGYTSGQAVKVGSMVGIAMGSAAQDEECEVKFDGEWTVTKAAGTAWAQGDKLYFDPVANNFTKTATSNTAAGYAAAAALAADTSGSIVLRQNA